MIKGCHERCAFNFFFVVVVVVSVCRVVGVVLLRRLKDLINCTALLNF
jgi:hypothetical protein